MKEKRKRGFTESQGDVDKKVIKKRKDVAENDTVSVLDDLRGADPVSGLQKLAQTPQIFQEFVQLGGQAKDFFGIFKGQDFEKVKSPDVATLFMAIESLATFSKSNKEGHVTNLMREVAKMILEDHLSYVLMLISPTNSVYQTVATLNMLSELLSLDMAIAKQVLVKLDFEHKSFDTITNRSQEIRASYINFLLSFLNHGNSILTKMFLDKKTRFSITFQDLKSDPASLVTQVLHCLSSKIVQNSNIAKTQKMKLFSVFNVKPLINLLINWKGPEESTEPDLKEKEKELVVEGVNTLMKQLLTNVKLGIVFHDPTCGSSGQNQNHLLLNILQTLNEPWINPNLSNLVALALLTCPDQIRPYMSTLEKFWNPSDTKNWQSLAEFLIVLFSNINWNQIVAEISDLKTIIGVISNILFHEKMMREMINISLCDAAFSVLSRGINILHLTTTKLSEIFKNLLSPNEKKQILYRISHRLPNLATILQLLDRVIEDQNDENHVLKLAQILEFVASNFPDKVNSKIQEEFNLPAKLAKLQALPNSFTESEMIIMKLILDQNVEFEFNKSHIVTLVDAYVTLTSSQDLALKILFKLLHSQCYSIDTLQCWLHHLAEQNQNNQVEITTLISETFEKLRTSVHDEEKVCLFSHLMVVNKKMSQKFSNYTLNVLQSLLTIIDTEEKRSLFIKDVKKCKPLKSEKSLVLVVNKFSGDETGEQFSMKELNDKNHPFSCFLDILKYLTSSERNFDHFSVLLDAIKAPKVKSEVVKRLLEKTHQMDKIWKENRDIVLKMLQVANSDEKEKFKQRFIKDEDNQGGHVEVSFQVFEFTKSEIESLLMRSMSKSNSVELIAQIFKYFNENSICSNNILNICQSKEFTDFLQDTLKRKVTSNETESRKLWGNLAIFFSQNLYGDFRFLNEDFIRELLENVNLTWKFMKTLIKLNKSHSTLIITKIWNSKSFHSNFTLSCEILATILESSSLKMEENPKVFKKIMKFLEKRIKKILDEPEFQFKNPNFFKIIQILAEDYQVDLVTQLGLKYEDSLIVNLPQLQLWHFMASKIENTGLKSKISLKTIVFAKENMKTFLNTNQENFGDLMELLNRVSSWNLICLMKDSESWKGLISQILKHGLKCTNDDIRATSLASLSQLCRMKYSEDSVIKDQVKLISEMVIGHSMTLSILMDTANPHTKSKHELATLVSILIDINPEICSQDLVILFLGAYTGSLSKSDSCILKIIHQHEVSGVSLSQFSPMMWGQEALNQYSRGNGIKMSGSLWKKPKISEILNLIDSDKMLKTAINFPTTLRLDIVDQNFDDDSLYDPRFFMPLICQLSSPGNFIDRHMKFIESGALALTLSSLASTDGLMRTCGYVILSRIHHQFQIAKLSAEKQVWIHLIDVLRNGVQATNTSNATQLRIPSIVAVFLVKVSIILHNPLDFMYKSISNFILAKPHLDLFNVPEFFRLFQSAELNYTEEQNWILGVIRDGMKDELDFNVAQKSFVSKLIMSCHASELSNPLTRSIIRQVLLKMVRMRHSAFEMIKVHGLSAWIITEIGKYSKYSDESINELFEIAYVAWKTISRSLELQNQLAHKNSFILDFRTTFASLTNYKFNNQCERNLLDVLLSIQSLSE